MTEEQYAVMSTGGAASREIPLFLTPDHVLELLDYCRVPEESISAVERRLPEILSDPEAVRLLVDLRRQVFPDRPEDAGNPAQWPTIDEADNLLGIGYLLVAASMVPLVREAHRPLGVPAEVTRDTCAQVSAFCGNHLVAHDGKPGILPRQLYWLRHYTAGRLFRIGRFEYMAAEYHHAGPAYRQRERGWVLTFADPERWVRPDGRVLLDDAAIEASSPGRDSERAPEGAEPFRPILAIAADSVTGNPVDPDGVVSRAPVTISLSDWQAVLQPGDPVLDMHIPAGGGMHPDLCRDSFADAFAFFDDCFPDLKARAIVCRSWIFNTQVEERMPDSNLAALMREVYLVPAFSGGTDGLFFVFCRSYDSLSEYPRQTRLQRALLDVLESGDTLRTTGMIYLRNELSRFGTQPYRSDWSGVVKAIAGAGLEHDPGRR